MKNIKKTIALFAMLFNVFSICNNVNKEPIEANAASKVTPDLITTPENPKNVSFCCNFPYNFLFSDKFLDIHISNCIVTNNKSTFLSFDAIHNSNIVEDYPQEIGLTKEQFLTLLAYEDREVEGEDGNFYWESVQVMTFEEAETMLREKFGAQIKNTKDPRTTNNSNESFYLGGYLYANTEDPTKFDLMLYADVDAIIVGPSMFKNFEYLEHVDFEGCYAADLDYMFYGCKSLTSIDLKGLNCEDWYMEKNGIKTIINEGCSDFSSMFEGCTSLVEVNFSNLPFAHGALVKEGDKHLYGGDYNYGFSEFVCESNYTAMFKGCTNLQRVNLSASYIKSFNDKWINNVYGDIEINNENILNNGRYIPFVDVLFNWSNGETENEIYSRNDEQVIYTDVEHFVNQYGEMFADCDNLTVVAFPNIISILKILYDNEIVTDLNIGLFINSNVENMLNCSLIGNVLVSNSVPEDNLMGLAELYKTIYTMDTCNGDSEVIDEILNVYEEINSNPDFQNEVFILNNLYYTEGFHKVTAENGKTTTTYDKELYLIKAMGKIDYMLSLPNKDENITSQNDIITAFISNNYNAFIVIGLVSLVSIIAYYIIEKKKVVNN